MNDTLKVEPNPCHRHYWRLYKERNKMIIYKCTGCPERLIEQKGDVVILDDGRLGVIVKK